LGPNGKPVSYFLYPTPRWNQRQYRPRYWLSADTKTNVSEYDRWELVNYSRQLFAQIGNLSTAIKDKNSWAFGDAWDPHYCGTNAKWGDEATEFLKLQFYPMCNVRGPLYDLKRSLRLSGQAWDIDGDDAMILTQSQTGFPQVAFFPSTRVGTQAAGMRGSMDGSGQSTGTVDGGEFDGAKIFDGVIYDRNLRMIGLRIVGEDGKPQDISAYNADLAYEADWGDQGRGIPRIATCLLRWMNMQDIDEFLQRGLKRASSIGLKVKNEEGQAAMGNEVITSEVDAQLDSNTVASGNVHSNAQPQIYYEEAEGGEIYYLSSTTGEDIEGLDYRNPHPNSEAFVERIVRESIASVGWLYELMNLTSTGRAPARLSCDIANQSIWDRQNSGYRRWKRMTGYAIAKGMKEGFLSPNNDGIDPYLWEPGFPKQLSCDAGNDEQADRENLKMGTTSKAIIAQKKGYYRKDIEAQRKEEVRALIAMAKEIHDESPEVPFEKVMDLLEQRNPNGTMPPRPQSGPPTKPS
jgi:hypothetical protein